MGFRMKGILMRSFDYSKLAEKAWDNEILNLVAKIHECKGRQDLFVRQKPVELDRLVEIAKIQSTESSNKIEGIVTTSTRMKQLFEEKVTPRNRDEDEIMGYRDVLNTIHESNEYIPIRPSYILQLHRDLLKRAGFSFGGHFKNVQNYINQTNPDGTALFRYYLQNIHKHWKDRDPKHPISIQLCHLRRNRILQIPLVLRQLLPEYTWT